VFDLHTQEQRQTMENHVNREVTNTHFLIFVGAIPEEIGQLTGLTFLDLSGNTQWNGQAYVGGLTGRSFVWKLYG